MNKHFLILVTLALTLGVSYGQSNKKYDYMTIVVEKLRPRMMYISDNGEKYEQVRLDSTQGDFDYNEVIKVIKRFERDGYEIQENNLSFWSGGMQSNTYNYFLLRRERKE